MTRSLFLTAAIGLAAGCDPTAPPDGASSCATANDCANLQYCILGACEDVSGASFYFQILDASAATHTDWDDDGPPDPYVVISIDGDPACQTDTLTDTYTPEWDDGCDLVFEENTVVGVEMFDEDGASDWHMWGMSINGIDALASMIGTGGYAADYEFCQVSWRIDPA